ncbi:hypothetical protein GA0070606_4088 [Micromonospora citrea]|uniref:Uncharacterized protein n=1 Tax=Micromonospora citrea TaxID=47855 RepID=A0A1C6VG18_9ACTN|nr:hypothetical protein [Micromonospora citrea]SCL65127.1 hypothetical protein GA0070606_4088 [Micromonospora citrea]
MKAHRTDIVSFAFGLIFVGIAAWWLLAQLLGLALPPVGWFLAGALIVIGLLGLMGALRSGRNAATGQGTATAPDGAGPASAPPAPGASGAAADPADVDPTRWDLDRATPADDPTTREAGRPDPGPAEWGRRSDWGQPAEWGGRSEWDVSAPVSGGRPEWDAAAPVSGGRPEWDAAAPVSGGRPGWEAGAPVSGERAEWDVSAPVSGGRPESQASAPVSGGRPESGATPVSGGPSAEEEADERPTDAVTDVRADAVEDRPAEEDDRPRPTGGPSADEERPRG